MTYQYWMGTDESLHALAALEREVQQMRLATASSSTPDKQAFMFMFDDDDDDQDDNRLGSHLIEKVGDIGVIKISGSLTNAHQGWHRYMTGRVTSYEALRGALSILSDDEATKKIVLKVSTGGGAVTGIDSVAQYIRRVDAKKPVTAHTGTMAFSAGYWLASAAREVVADRMAELGSIGTLMVHQSLSRMAEKEGIDVTVFRAGKFKAAGHPMEALDEETRAYLQADVEKANSFFLDHVARRRGLSISSKGIWAEGKTFFAEEAKSVGLIDRVAEIDDLLITSASGAAYHHRSSDMQLSPEKLAQIEAGAAPETVLTDVELTQYKAEMAIAAEEAPVEPAAPVVAEEAPTEPAEPTTSVASASTQDLMKEMGRLEARLEARDEKIAALEAKASAREETFQSLLAIGAEAVNKRELALGKPYTSPSTPEAMISTYHTLAEEMGKRFQVGQTSNTPTATESVAGGIPQFMKTQKRTGA